MRSIFKTYLTLLLSACLACFAFGQEDEPGKEGQVIDKIAGIVGKKVILLSELRFQYQQYKNQGLEQGYDISGQGRAVECQLLNEMLKEKMLLTQSKEDSVTVKEEEVTNELNRRIRYFVSMIGSRQKLEEYYGKSIVEIKDEFRSDIRDRLIAQKMRQQIIRDVKVTPTEVKEYFHNMPEDSLPYFNAKVEMAQVVRYPAHNRVQDSLARAKAENLRERIREGEDFETLAIIYSQDKQSAQEGGELGFRLRDELPNALQGVAFNLDPGKVSRVVKSKEGYHLVKLLERRGERVNLRHILIKPTITNKDLTRAEAFLDSIRTLVSRDSLTFAAAARRFSQDEESKHNGGVLMNQASGSTYFNMKELDPSLYFAIEELEPGEISDPVLFRDKKGRKGYKIVKLISESEPHQASLEKDYDKIQKAALQQKQTEVIKSWLAEKTKETYIFVAPDFHDCTSLQYWIKYSEQSN